MGQQPDDTSHTETQINDPRDVATDQSDSQDPVNQPEMKSYTTLAMREEHFFQVVGRGRR